MAFLVWLTGGVSAACDVNEQEGNNDFEESQYIDMQNCLNSDEGIKISGRISDFGDVDVYEIQ